MATTLLRPAVDAGWEVTLLAKGFSVPPWMDGQTNDEDAAGKRELVDDFRKAIRRGEVAGHLPICWGLLANASGLALGG